MIYMTSTGRGRQASSKVIQYMKRFLQRWSAFWRTTCLDRIEYGLVTKPGYQIASSSAIRAFLSFSVLRALFFSILAPIASCKWRVV
jgi:hypothetical protein